MTQKSCGYETLDKLRGVKFFFFNLKGLCYVFKYIFRTILKEIEFFINISRVLYNLGNHKDEIK